MNETLSDALREFTGLLKQLITNLLGNEADLWGNELRKFLRKEPCWAAQAKAALAREFELKPTEAQLSEWVILYKEMGIDLDISGVKIPERKSDFDRLIVVAEGQTPNCAYEECAKRFPCWKYAGDLDKAVSTNDRDPKNGTYAVWVRDRVEADEELKSKSADDLTEAGIKGITLTERLLYELKYFTETGKHLDLKNWTLCSGSRGSDGHVPSVRWRGDRLRVYWDGPATRYSSLRSREAVTL